MDQTTVSLLDSNVCTVDEYRRFLRGDGGITCLTKGDTVGLVMIVVAGLLSLGAVLCLFAIIARNSRRRGQETKLFYLPMDLLMFSVLWADIIQAIGMILNLRWIMLGKVEEGSFCTLQGAVKGVGCSSVALFTLAIALYTFLGVWLTREISSMRITIVVVLVIWIFDATLTMVGPLVNLGEGKPSYMSTAPYWCSTSKRYLPWKTATDYVFRWATLFFSIFIYVPLYLWLRGNLDFDRRRWWKVYFRWRPKAGGRAMRGKSFVMLAYPMVYCVLILPLTVVRWITWWVPQEHYDVPPSATFATDAIFGLSGLFNAILLVTTRPKSSLFGRLTFASGLPESEDEATEMDEVSEDHDAHGRLPP